MTTTTVQIPLRPPEFDRLRDVIFRLSGLSYAENKHYLLESRLQERLERRRLKDFSEYLRFLDTSPLAQEELTYLFNQITTNETSFYRNPPQISAFQYQVMPAIAELKRRRGQNRIRIWSAGCSSGEEPYTLAIAVREALGPDFPAWRITIEANDISNDMLERAKKAEYGDYALRATPLSVKEKWFSQNGDSSWRPSPEIREMVRFGFLNLSDEPAMRGMAGFDVIFCRNVLIYFDADMKKKIVGHFHRALLPGGWLFVGHSEAMAGVTQEFELHQFTGALAYTKRGE